MSKRSQPDSQRADNLPSPKKPRYNYDIQLMQQRTLPRMTTNSDEETVSETEQTQETVSNTHQPTLISTKAPIPLQSLSKRRIPNEASNKSRDDWCPLQWFRNRVYHSDAEEFFHILPHDEADGVTKELLMHVGAATTLITNTIHNIDIMNSITKHIQNKHEKDKNKDENHYHSAKKSIRLSNKQKKRWIREQNEVLNTFNSHILHFNTQKYINKIQKDVERYHNNETQYNLYENERKSIWKSIPNGNTYTITPTPPPNNTNYDSFLSQNSCSSSDSDSDCSLKKKKGFKPKKEASIDPLYTDGKNPLYTDTQPSRFWSKFRPYFAPTDPLILQSLIPSLQGDAYPVKIPSLPNEKSFINKSYFSDDISFDDINNDISFDDLYFAEMPKNYEYFGADKCYIDEQQNIESITGAQYLKRRAIHQHYPSLSLMGHSFDQRTLSCLVHECAGMYNIEHEVDENYWTKIGKKKEYNMIEPMIKYTQLNTQLNTFEESLRQQIGKIFFNDDREELHSIVSMPWHRRLDDECCATIKSLEGTMETICFDDAPNDVDINIKIAMEIMQIIQNQDGRNYDSYQVLINHLAEIEKNYMESNGTFVIDEETLSQPGWAQYFKEKENLPIEQAVKAFVHQKHVRTVQK